MPLSTIGRFASAAGMQIVGAVGTLLGVSIIFFVLTDCLPGGEVVALAVHPGGTDILIHQDAARPRRRESHDPPGFQSRGHGLSLHGPGNLREIIVPEEPSVQLHVLVDHARNSLCIVAK